MLRLYACPTCGAGFAKWSQCQSHITTECDVDGTDEPAALKERCALIQASAKPTRSTIWNAVYEFLRA